MNRLSWLCALALGLCLAASMCSGCHMAQEKSKETQTPLAQGVSNEQFWAGIQQGTKSGRIPVIRPGRPGAPAAPRR
jgi:cytochrome c553